VARMLSRQASNFTCLQLGEFTLALEDLVEGLSLFDPADRPFYAEVLAYDPLAALLAISAPSLASLGYLDQAVLRRGAGAAGAGRGAPALPSPDAGGRAGTCFPNRLEHSLGSQIVVTIRRRASGTVSRAWPRTVSDDGTRPARLVPGGIGACGRRHSTPHQRS